MALTANGLVISRLLAAIARSTLDNSSREVKHARGLLSGVIRSGISIKYLSLGRESGDRSQEAGVRRQELGVRRQESGGRRK
ncbi:hypothetical protein V0288_18940 [Pannus brasiliensis CCIBt3594]|uniref:Uncharacterized protein n=1 Tax=Pannus brasiliensis CCIBt3594 TaxID=1427578 RepID=A0AAW9QV59_9CHRO